MKPLRIEWRLTNPVTGMQLPLHLDALVAYAITEEALLGGAVKGSIRSIAKDLPLEKASKGDLFCWKASALMPVKVLGHEMQMWTRKFPEEEFSELYINDQLTHVKGPINPVNGRVELAPYAGVINTGMGIIKNYFQHIPVRQVDHFIAFCIGDMDRLTELLSPLSGFITTIGGRKRQSAGRVSLEEGGFLITVDEFAQERWQDRILPWEKEGYVPIQAAHKPPYWAIENRSISYIHPDLQF